LSQIRAIQCLRAIAALMVVFAHARADAALQAARLGVGFPPDAALPWVAGVDLFFVTSGFIMVHASRDLFGAPGAGRVFLTRRLIRIAPLYWLVTVISLVVLLFAARAGRAAFPPVREILGSFAFVPYQSGERHELRPIAGQGWTLNYEMFFYVLFALFIRLPRHAAIVGVALMLALLVALGEGFRPQSAALSFWCDPIVLEFALGMGIAWGWAHGFRFSRVVAALLGVAAVVWLALDLDQIRAVPLDAAEPNGFWRVVGCGAPMALLFAAAVCVVPPFSATSRVGARAAEIGDASYALYLFHPLSIILARKAYLAANLDAALGLWPLVVADVAAALAVALAIHRFVENPMTRGLRRAFLGASERSRADPTRRWKSSDPSATRAPTRARRSRGP
jgi:peptidoglycan/LPS O-acetylase OafA/YrhL